MLTNSHIFKQCGADGGWGEAQYELYKCMLACMSALKALDCTRSWRGAS